MKEDEKQVPFLLTKRIRFHDATPPLASIADVYVEELLHLPSPHMTSREMLQLRKRIEETTANEQMEGLCCYAWNGYIGRNSIFF
ncbi:hypothetical protein A7K69_03345 [Parageobacillus thermoglucosidasius]|uniref:L-asparaginase N-terminal domain-containing protein n=1 Tax=Parageobacillus thermoglucosidasius TaxID=1426 RepID=A0A1B7KXC9_PARTM|nr:asparaginase domain-containing protein [Parageobacillus thermoglucosidasius]OAT74760.1 hypothetical protein A7K69_03345 [Parageobacillus thermoglucosidasius]